MNNPNQKLIDDLLAAAKFLERPGLPRFNIYGTHLALAYMTSKEEFATFARAMGSGKKSFSNNYAGLDKTVGVMEFRVYAARETICHRVQVGEKAIPAQPERIEPAQPERILPAEPERIEPIYEWVCPESLLAPQDDPLAETALAF